MNKIRTKRKNERRAKVFSNAIINEGNVLRISAQKTDTMVAGRNILVVDKNRRPLGIGKVMKEEDKAVHAKVTPVSSLLLREVDYLINDQSNLTGRREKRANRIHVPSVRMRNLGQMKKNNSTEMYLEPID